jgi:hypothetical protein
VPVHERIHSQAAAFEIHPGCFRYYRFDLVRRKIG